MSEYKNFAVLTLAIEAAEKRTSKKGEDYLVAQASLVGQNMPFKLIVTNGLIRVLEAGKTFTLKGELGYEEHNQDGTKIPTYLFFPNSFDAEAEKDRNFVNLTLRVGQEPQGQYSQNTGCFWAKTRMAMGFGKDQKGNWKPSLWYSVKAWNKATEDEGTASDLYALSQGDKVVISGRLVYEVNQESGRGYPTIHATKVVVESSPEEEPAAQPEAELVEEP